MKKHFITFLLLVGMTASLTAQQKYQPTEANLKARSEFQDNKFGIFLHWGLYAMPATFMSAVSCTYFVLAPECLGKMINTYADGKLVAYNTAVAYPIGIIFAIAMLALFIHATKKHTASQKA